MDAISLTGSMMVAAMWGASPTFQTHFAKEGIQGPTIAMISGIAYALGGALWWWLSGHRTHISDHYKVFLASGLIATMIPNLLYILILSQPHVCPTLTSVIAFTAPAFTALYMAWFFGAQLKFGHWIGIFLIMLGTACAVFATGN